MQDARYCTVNCHRLQQSQKARSQAAWLGTSTSKHVVCQMETVSSWHPSWECKDPAAVQHRRGRASAQFHRLLFFEALPSCRFEL